MLKIIIPNGEMFDETSNKFIVIPETELMLEHSLYTISKWESKWHESFFTTFSNKEKISNIQFIDYIKCMTMNKVPPNCYYFLNEQNISDINNYMQDSMTATTFNSVKSYSRAIITNELLYYQLFSYGISLECEHWHINRLLTLIKVFHEMNKPEEKRSKQEMYKERVELNNKRLEQYKSSG